MKLSNKSDSSFDLNVIYSKEFDFNTLVLKMLNEGGFNVNIYSESPTDILNEIKNQFKVRLAAGGKVFNSQREILFIYRLEHWDLPKGHVEKGETIEETAIREVEEETSVKVDKVDREFKRTYHIYQYEQDLVLKESVWFEMTSSYNGELIGQAEEGIEEVRWVSEKELPTILEKSWANIKLLF